MNSPADLINQHIQNSRELECKVPVKVLSAGEMRKARHESSEQAKLMTDDHVRDHLKVRRLQGEMRSYREVLACAVEALNRWDEGSVVNDTLNRIAQLLEGQS